LRSARAWSPRRRLRSPRSSPSPQPPESGLDLVGVDLLPTGPGGFCAIELNGAVDYRPVYSFPGRDAHTDTMAALGGAQPSESGAIELFADQIS
jgi:hypothetical protein